MEGDIMKSSSTKEKNSLFKKMLLSLTFSRGGRTMDKRQVTPDGCFPVRVGPEKQKFVIKAEYANHPLFKMLLEDAELEYGFTCPEGPIWLPCEVELFVKVLAEMDSGREVNYGCGFAYSSCSPFSPSRRLGRNSFLAKGYGSYGALTPSRLLKMNNF